MNSQLELRCIKTLGEFSCTPLPSWIIFYWQKLGCGPCPHCPWSCIIGWFLAEDQGIGCHYCMTSCGSGRHFSFTCAHSTVRILWCAIIHVFVWLVCEISSCICAYDILATSTACRRWWFYTFLCQYVLSVFHVVMFVGASWTYICICDNLVYR